MSSFLVMGPGWMSLFLPGLVFAVVAALLARRLTGGQLWSMWVAMTAIVTGWHVFHFWRLVAAAPAIPSVRGMLSGFFGWYAAGILLVIGLPTAMATGVSLFAARRDEPWSAPGAVLASVATYVGGVLLAGVLFIIVAVWRVVA